MSLRFSNPLARFSAGTPLALSLQGIKVAGVGMEADPTVANRAFFKEASMTCSHCSAQMFPESSLRYTSTDYTPDLGDAQTMQSVSWRCIYCGNWEDAVVVANRAAQRRCLLEQAA